MLVVQRRPLLFADDAEQRARAPVRQVVVAAFEMNGTEVGDEHRTVVRVLADQEIGGTSRACRASG